MDLDMPQLRQLVLKNTERIDKNELMIKQMRKESMEQARKSAERDEWLENSRREHDRWARSMRETLDEIAQYSKQSQIEQEMRSLELDARFAETDRQLKETSLEVKRLSRQLSGTTGHIVEGLVSSSTEKLFEKVGLVLHNSGKNLKRSLPSENIAMEVDVLLSNEELAIPIEVKANCTKDDVRWFLHQMSHFRRLFPEYDGKEVVAAIAAINYEKGAAELAHREKLLVIRVNSDDIFSIDPFQKDELRKF